MTSMWLINARKPPDAVEEARQHLHAIVTDRNNYFVARWLTNIKRMVNLKGVDEPVLAKLLALCLAFYLCTGTHANFVANFLLMAVPTMMTWMYPDEKPTNEELLIYWPCLATSMLSDQFLEFIHGWYAFKIVLLGLLFLRPLCLAEKAHRFLEVMLIHEELSSFLGSYSGPLPAALKSTRDSAHLSNLAATSPAAADQQKQLVATPTQSPSQHPVTTAHPAPPSEYVTGNRAIPAPPPAKTSVYVSPAAHATH